MLKGVGHIAEQKLSELEPLIAFYEREMGTFAGRLMLVVNFLRDAKDMKTPLTPEVKAAIESAEALAVSVMTRLLLARAEDERQGGCGCKDVKDQVRTWLDESLKA